MPVFRLRQRLPEGQDLGADIPVIGPLPLGDGVVGGEDGKAVCQQVPLQLGKIVVKELVENGEVAFRNAVFALRYNLRLGDLVAVRP